MRNANFVAPGTAESQVPVPLNELPLSASALAVLRTQGEVVARPRGRNREAYFLRFRMGGREQAIFLGVDGIRAAAVGAALEQWQQQHRFAR